MNGYLDRLSAHLDGELDAGEAMRRSPHTWPHARTCAGEYTLLLNTVEIDSPAHAAARALRTHCASAFFRQSVRVPADSAPRARAGPDTALDPRVGRRCGSGRNDRHRVRDRRAQVAAPLNGPTADALLTAHVRSLQQGHLTDVVSSDQHTVKPWFTGKLDFSPAVPRLESEGFPLVGGRLDYVGDRAVAALVYQRRAHIINVVTYPAESEKAVAPHLESHRGYQIANWSAGGMTYWVVSDLNADELRSFCTLMREADAR